PMYSGLDSHCGLGYAKYLSCGGGQPACRYHCLSGDVRVMGVEIEIEGGPQTPAPVPIQQTTAALQWPRYMDDDANFIYLASDPGFFGSLDPVAILRIDKANFLNPPVSLILSNPNDLPSGICAANDGFVYVPCRDTGTGLIAVTRIDKATFTVQSRFAAGAGVNGPGPDPF